VVETKNQNILSQYLTETLKADLAQFNYTVKFKDLASQGEKFFSEVSAPVLADIFDAFGRRSYNNAVILGLPGVGKTFLINQLTCLFSYGITPKFLESHIGIGNA